jgi:O-antigen ligase
MSLTALAFVAVYSVGLCLAFYRPIFGLCTYVWTFYSSPSTAWWGVPLPDLRWSITAAVVTLLAYLLVGSSSEPRVFRGPGGEGEHLRGGQPAIFTNWGMRLLLILVAWMWVQSLWAVDSTRHFDGCILLTKLMVLYVLMDRLLADERALEGFAWTHVIGAFTWGWYAYRTSISGRFEPMLGPGVDDANALGFQMVTATAFAGFMFVGVPGWKRWVAFATLPFLLNVIILTASRSALVALVAAAIVALWLTPRDKRRIAYACAVLGVLLFLRLAGSELFWQRTATLGETNVEEMDYSAASRLDVAAANWRMFLDHPLGAGYLGNMVLSPVYMPARVLGQTGFRSAHNTFLAILVDAGIPGAVVFVALAVWAVAILRRLKSLDKAGFPARLGIYRAAAGAGLGAYYVSGQFINLWTTEVWVWLFAVIAALTRLSADAHDESPGVSSPEPAALSHGSELARRRVIA